MTAATEQDFLRGVAGDWLEEHDDKRAQFVREKEIIIEVPGYRDLLFPVTKGVFAGPVYTYFDVLCLSEMHERALLEGQRLGCKIAGKNHLQNKYAVMTHKQVHSRPWWAEVLIQVPRQTYASYSQP